MQTINGCDKSSIRQFLTRFSIGSCSKSVLMQVGWKTGSRGVGVGVGVENGEWGIGSGE